MTTSVSRATLEAESDDRRVRRRLPPALRVATISGPSTLPEEQGLYEEIEFVIGLQSGPVSFKPVASLDSIMTLRLGSAALGGTLVSSSVFEVSRADLMHESAPPDPYHVELTGDGTRTLIEALSRPGRHIPKLAAALSRRK